jgi:hypothetical protein
MEDRRSNSARIATARHAAALPAPTPGALHMPMNDPEIRTRLHAHFDKLGAPWVDEVAMGKRRIDMVAMVDGVLTGIEIKSGTDTLERLVAQLKAYRSRFRQLIVVIEEEHLESVVAAVPRWCGIWVAEQAGSAVYLKTRGRGCRKPQANRRGRVLELAVLPSSFKLHGAHMPTGHVPISKANSVGLLRLHSWVASVIRKRLLLV